MSLPVRRPVWHPGIEISKKNRMIFQYNDVCDDPENENFRKISGWVFHDLQIRVKWFWDFSYSDNYGFRAMTLMQCLMNYNCKTYWNILLRIHCFNNYGKNEKTNCPDLEVRYYIECSEETDLSVIKYRRNRRSPIVCRENNQKGFLTVIFVR